MADSAINSTMKQLCQRLDRVSSALDQTHTGHSELARSQDTLRQQHQTLMTMMAQFNNRLLALETVPKPAAKRTPRKRTATAAAPGKAKKPRAPKRAKAAPAAAAAAVFDRIES